MATPNASSSRPAAGASNSQEVAWSDILPIHVDREDAMSPVGVRNVWSVMMSKAKLRTPTEQEQRAFRLAVYVYGVKNGTSREGSYAGTIIMSTGHEFPAAVIPQSTGKMMIRKFFRGNADEAYDALKMSGAIANDEVMVAKAAELSINASEAFAMADFLSECPKLTPGEKQASQKAFAHGTERARRARGGVSLEAVEGERVDDQLSSQGPEHVAERKALW